MSRKSTGLVELYLGPQGIGKRKWKHLIGGVIVEDYNSNLHGGRVVVVKLAPAPNKGIRISGKPKNITRQVITEAEAGLGT